MANNGITIDASYCQAPDSIDWEWMKANDVCAILRAGQWNFEDNRFKEHYGRALAKGKLPASYWFLQPDQGHQVQVQTYLKIHNGLLVRPQRVFLDIENISYYENFATDKLDQSDKPRDLPQNNPAWSRAQVPAVYRNRRSSLMDSAGLINIIPPSKEAATWWAHSWLEEVQAGTGLERQQMGLYSRKNHWDYWILPSGTRYQYNGIWHTAPIWSDYLLWVASWVQYSQNIAMLRDWSTWTIWQYMGGAGRLPGGVVGPVDLNQYNGDAAEMQVFFGEKPNQEEEPTMQHNGIELSWKQDLDPAKNYDEVPLDWAKIKSHPLGFSYVYVKAGDGAGPDEYAAYNYARQYKTAGAAGMMRGAWHVWRWAKPAADQAAWFKACAAEGTGELRPMVVLVDDYLTEYTKRWQEDSARGDAWLVTLAMELLKYLDNVKQYFGKSPLVKMTPAWWDKMGHVLALKDDATKKLFDTFFLCGDFSPAGSPGKLFELTAELYIPTNTPQPPVEGILGTYLPILRCDDDGVWANFAAGAIPPSTTPGTPGTPPATGDMAEVISRLKAIQAWLHMP